MQHSLYLSFNSSVVRLVAKISLATLQALMFQFQCGAIGRRLQRPRSRLYLRFNSSVVRLVVKEML